MQKKFFYKAIKLAKSVKGITSPNPSVGCVIVKNNKIVGYGATQKAGSEHAEIIALKMAGPNSNEAEMYVTLEPCVCFECKRTPSCADSIIKSGIKKVYIGMIDPNPNVNGKGIEKLKNNGINVEIVNEFYDELRELNEDFEKYIKTNIPFVYAKYAMTLDGNIASCYGDSKWISCEESRKLVPKLRNQVDSIMVGVGTIIKDNPELTVRLVKKLKNPLRIIIDPSCKTPVNSNVLIDNEKTLFVISKQNTENNNLFKKYCEKYNKEWLELEIDNNSNIFNLQNLLEILGKERKISSILIEGGSKLLYYSFQQKIIDKIIVFISPKLIGGSCLHPFNGFTNLKISESLKLINFTVENIGDDIMIKGYLNELYK